jgi:D-amino peptidase
VDEAASAAGFDAMFLVGFHARAGTPDGFISHTMVPGLKVFVDGAPLTEPHIWAWLEGLPVLGVAGDRALGGQLDGFLEGTPFLAVKDSSSRYATMLTPRDRAERLASLTDFAEQCARQRIRALTFPTGFTFSVELDPGLAAAAHGAAGLRTVSPGVLAKPATDWVRDAWPALQRAMQAALQPMLAAQGDLDLGTEERMRRQQPGDLERLRAYLSDWVAGE